MTYRMCENKNGYWLVTDIDASTISAVWMEKYSNARDAQIGVPEVWDKESFLWFIGEVD